MTTDDPSGQIVASSDSGATGRADGPTVADVSGTVDAAAVVAALTDYLGAAERWRAFRRIVGDFDPAGDGWALQYEPVQAAAHRLVAALGGDGRLLRRFTDAIAYGLHRGHDDGQAFLAQHRTGG